MSKKPIAAADFSAPLYPLQDMHSQHIQFIPLSEAQRLLKLGFAQTYGNKKRIIGVRLTVPLSTISEDVPTPRPMTPANYCGKRYVFKETLDNDETGLHAYVFRLKRLSDEESPELALRRILTPPALEAQQHLLYDRATEEEQKADPARHARSRASDVFRIVAHPRRKRKRQQVSEEPSRLPLRAPLWKPNIVILEALRRVPEEVADLPKAA